MTDESLDLRFTRFLLESQALKFGDTRASRWPCPPPSR